MQAEFPVATSVVEIPPGESKVIVASVVRLSHVVSVRLFGNLRGLYVEAINHASTDLFHGPPVPARVFSKERPIPEWFPVARPGLGLQVRVRNVTSKRAEVQAVFMCGLKQGKQTTPIVLPCGCHWSCACFAKG